MVIPTYSILLYAMNIACGIQFEFKLTNSLTAVTTTSAVTTSLTAVSDRGAVTISFTSTIL